MPVLKAEAAVYGGYVISRSEGVVFIRGAIPGEVVDVSIKEKKRDYSIAEINEIIEPSADRREAPCRYFGSCGGCQLQFASYDRQVLMKGDVLLDCLRRIGGIEAELAPPMTGEDFHYRRRAQFKVSKDGEIGFYMEGTRDIVPIEECPLMVQDINDALGRLVQADLKGIKEIHMTSGDCLLALVRGMGLNEGTAKAMAEMGFKGVAFDGRTWRGEGHVTLDLLGLKYTISPWSFFQSNWELNTRTAALIVERTAPQEGMRVLDLYAGAGNFSLPLAAEGAEVVAIEDNPRAIKDGRRNVSLNKIKGFKFVRTSAEDAKLAGNFDLALLDPPRPGLTRTAMKNVLKAAPARIAYVSCNPATFARDLKKLSDKYTLDEVRLVDFFPNTYHLEAVAFMTKKEGDG